MSPRGDPEDDDGPPVDTGIRSMDLGSSFPEGSYRPVPIVWLAGAWLLLNVAGVFVYLLLSGYPPIVRVVAIGLLALVIGGWTFDRGMKHAGAGWKLFTAAVLLANWAFVALIAFA